MYELVNLNNEYDEQIIPIAYNAIHECDDCWQVP
jgi:hypothetical protein